MPRRVIAVLFAALCLALVAGGGAAQAKPKGHNCPNPAGHYPPGQCKFLTSSTKGPAGSKVGVGGQNYSANNTVAVFFDKTKVGAFATGPQGGWKGQITIPTSAKNGAHYLTAYDKKTGFTQQVKFVVSPGKGNTVAASASSNPFANLPHTGAVIIPVAAAGGALVIGGAALIVAGRRRRSTLAA